MAITNIRDLATTQTAFGKNYPGSPWRGQLLPAHFDGRLFHCESGGRESGRRVVTHEFPKKDFPYSEDMGRRIINFTVRGYCIQFVKDTGSTLYRRDYTLARDLLQRRLDTGGPGTLQLPMMRSLTVVCQRYRLQEEEKLGGYCTFDMQFTELGAPPFETVVSSYDKLVGESERLREEIKQALAPEAPGSPFRPGIPKRPLPPVPPFQGVGPG